MPITWSRINKERVANALRQLGFNQGSDLDGHTIFVIAVESKQVIIEVDGTIKRVDA